MKEMPCLSTHSPSFLSVAKPAGKHLHLHALAAYCHGAQGELGWLNTDESVMRFTSSTEHYHKRTVPCRFDIQELYMKKGKLKLCSFCFFLKEQSWKASNQQTDFHNLDNEWIGLACGSVYSLRLNVCQGCRLIFSSMERNYITC